MAEELIQRTETLVAKHKALLERRDKLKDDKARVDAELDARKRQLKKTMEDARKEGFDPDNLKADLQKKVEVLEVKLNNFDADLTEAEKIIRPLLEEVRRG